MVYGQNNKNFMKPDLYIHYNQATHFLRWELPYWRKHFNVRTNPSSDTVLLSFGPDALNDSLSLPSLKKFAVLFPGFSHNPLYNPEIRELHKKLIPKFDQIFINPGPLEIAYKGNNNITFYPFSIDTKVVKLKKYRKRIDSLIHVSNPSPQKDWERSEKIMQLAGLKYAVFPPRSHKFYTKVVNRNNYKNSVRKLLSIKEKEYLPYGYVSHQATVKMYQKYDGFVHVARDVKDKIFIDGKYTASLIEAGVTGAILFWHDTFGLGNNLKSVFSVSLEPKKAAREILDIRGSIDVEKHSRLTRQEMLDTFNPERSVRIRAEKILELIS